MPIQDRHYTGLGVIRKRDFARQRSFYAAECFLKAAAMPGTSECEPANGNLIPVVSDDNS